MISVLAPAKFTYSTIGLNGFQLIGNFFDCYCHSDLVIFVLLLAPGEVRNVMATAASSASIQVSWMIPLCPNGIITQYRLYYRQTDTSQTANNIDITDYSAVVISSDSFTYLVSNLVPFMNYGFLVQALVNATAGPFPVEEIARTYSTTDSPPTVPPGATTSMPVTRNQVPYLIADPRQIDTGVVM